jgi:hypothetical protein
MHVVAVFQTQHKATRLRAYASLQSYYDRLRDIAEETEEELASPQRRRKSASEAPVPTPQPDSRPDSTAAAICAAAAEQPSAQPRAECLDPAVAPPAGTGADGRPGATQPAPQQAATEQKQKPAPGKKAVHRRVKVTDPAASTLAPPAAAEPLAAVQMSADPEAGQIRQLQAELQRLRQAAAEAELRHAADVASVTTQLEAARLAAAAAAQKADGEAADTARHLQAAESEVSHNAPWSCRSLDEGPPATVHSSLMCLGHADPAMSACDSYCTGPSDYAV